MKDVSAIDKLRHNVLVSISRKLNLRERVPALLRARGWSTHPDVVAVLSVAVACKKLGAGRTVIRRPPAFDDAIWPDHILQWSASQIVLSFELAELLEDN